MSTLKRRVGMAKVKGTTQPVYAGLGSIFVIVSLVHVEQLPIEVTIVALGSVVRLVGQCVRTRRD